MIQIEETRFTASITVSTSVKPEVFFKKLVERILASQDLGIKGLELRVEGEEPVLVLYARGYEEVKLKLTSRTDTLKENTFTVTVTTTYKPTLEKIIEEIIPEILREEDKQ